MKRLITVLLTTALLTGFAGCKEQYTSYSDAEYVMFSDTMSIHMVLQDQDFFEVPIASTTACNYDRTFGVEIIDKGSNAIERFHYRLLSNSVTIKAGERTADVQVKGIYDNIEDTDSLGFILKLIAPEQLESDVYTKYNKTKVVIQKSCPYSIDNFTGWCVVTSMFLYNYPHPDTPGVYQRLFQTKKHPTEENKIIMYDWLYDGYNVTLTFDASNPEKPFLRMDKDQVLTDSESIFGITYGDNKVLTELSTINQSYFNSCQHFASLWLHVYLTKLGDGSELPAGGNVGHFYNIMEWVSDEEAERLQREEGM